MRPGWQKHPTNWRPSTSARSIAPPPPPSDAILTRFHYWILTFVYVAFVFHGSLVPYTIEKVTWPEVFAIWKAEFHPQRLYFMELGSRTDALTNLLLFIPLGFVAMGAVCADKARRIGWVLAPAVWAGCVATGLFVEALQVWFPRNPSIRDVAAMSCGTVVGITGWLLGGMRLTNWCRRAWSAQGQSAGLAYRLLPVYCVMLFFVHVLPLDLTIHPMDIRDKYKEGGIILRPFSHQFADRSEAAEKHIWTVLYFAPLGVLLGHFDKRSWRAWTGIWKVAIVAVLAAASCEAMQLFVRSRTVDVSDIIVGSVSVLAAWITTLAYRQIFAAKPQLGRFAIKPVAGQLDPWLVRGLALAWIAIAVFVTWRPFDFRFESAFVSSRHQAINWMPFAAYTAQDYLKSLDEMTKKFLLFLYGGILVSLGLPAWKRHLVLPMTMGLAAAFACVLEMGQLYLPTRYFNVDDIFMEVLGAWVGCLLGNRGWTLAQRASRAAARR